jgi:signal-transduction protein with cAMP-binding, CBS, and nucleotidyltransferase domain
MRVSELMHTPPVTCAPKATVGDVARLMATRNVGSVIVVDEVGEVAGIVTDRDIAIRGVARGRSADIPVEVVVTKDVVMIEPAADVADAASRMLKRNVRRLPVVDDSGKVHGLVALDDLIRNVGRQADELGDLLLSQASALPLEP